MLLQLDEGGAPPAASAGPAPTKTPLKMPPGAVDATAQERGRMYAFGAAPHRGQLGLDRAPPHPFDGDRFRATVRILFFDYPSQRVVDPVLPSRKTFLEVINNVPIDAQRNEFFGAWERGPLTGGSTGFLVAALNAASAVSSALLVLRFLSNGVYGSSLTLAERRCRA
jgi:hypothetical protein